jgi:hypothetical protein
MPLCTCDPDTAPSANLSIDPPVELDRFDQQQFRETVPRPDSSPPVVDCVDQGKPTGESTIGEARR